MSHSDLPTLPPVFRRPWEATWWVHFLQQLGPDFPSPDASEAEWKRFVLKCIIAPAIVLAVGVVVSFCVLCCVCSCSSGDRRRARQRSSVPTSCAGLLALLLIVVGTIVYWQTGTRAAQTAEEQLDRAYGDASTAQQQGVTLQTLGADILSDLDSIAPACPESARDIVKSQVDPVRDQIKSYTTEVDRFVTDIQPMPGKLAQVKDKGEDATRVIAVGLLLPMALVLVSCFSVVLAVCLTRTGRCAGFCVCFLGPLLLVPTILVLTVAAAVQLQVGIVASSFCENADTNAVDYVGHVAGNQSLAYELSRYYIIGQGNNSLLEELRGASQELQSAQVKTQQFGALLGQYCPDWKRLPQLMGSLEQAQVSIQKGEALLAPSNVFPYYEQAVREDACKTVIVGLGWLVLFQVLVGLLCLPLVTCYATTYLKARLILHHREPLTPSRAAGV